MRLGAPRACKNAAKPQGVDAMINPDRNSYSHATLACGAAWLALFVTLFYIPAWVCAELRGRADPPGTLLQAYRDNLSLLRAEHPTIRDLPDVRFFLFGMGSRQKLIYREGRLTDGRSGEEVRRWEVAEEIIVPPAYSVYLRTRSGDSVRLFEDESGVWVEEKGRRTVLSQGGVRLPDFKNCCFGPVLRVLHQEILVNIVDGRPLPNFMVYSKPWYRDGAMVAMALKETGNLDLIRGWVLGLRQPFDRNNGGAEEADNPGQVLYLVSLFADRSHPIVNAVLEVLPRFRTGDYLSGPTDFSKHPVYQTKWAKFGLAALGLKDPFHIPPIPDSYSSLFWWEFKSAHVPMPSKPSLDYPYLTWAEDHFNGTNAGPVGNRDYPLTWEARASQARYDGMKVLSPEYTRLKLAAPHTWHAAEMFLLLNQCAGGQSGIVRR